MQTYLDFEKSLAEIEGKAEELRALARQDPEMDVEKEAKSLDDRARSMLADLYKGLTPWRKCQVARHPLRPHSLDYIGALFTEYTPLAGDRAFAEDRAVVGGLARFEDRPVVVFGHDDPLAADLGDHRRGRLGRSGGLRHGRPGGDAGALGLLGDQPRGLRLDPVEELREDARGRRGAAPDRPGPAQAGRARRSARCWASWTR